ncbi:16S rRNA (cytosine967-C5)-methyltransferase [Candidatus Thermokryptus mobilis]|uniref:16S rRNA (cytosine(967)-C(5))-methyltransferase n=2 Tax=Candidatus Thermokryptus mobilis TaxID=1643428 RepID=A0A0S4N7N8_9BACT|nr:16S rRNA (cytosine967-C5)-methyltransferase [Candidatus Thermokryptus mobilis]
MEFEEFYKGPRGIAVKILNRIERTDSYLDKLLDVELKSDELNDLDKRFLTELTHGVVRWKTRLDFVIEQFCKNKFAMQDPNIRNAMRVALYQILFLSKIPHAAAVNEAVEFVKKIRGQKAANLVNAVLRNIIRNLNKLPTPDHETDPVQYLSIMYSHPSWMVKRWVERYGLYETEQLLSANNERPTIVVRANSLKTTADELVKLFEERGIRNTRSKYVENFIKVGHLSKIYNLDLFEMGYFSVQDESSGLVVKLLDPKPGEIVIDLCSAPGGKTTFIGELMKNQGKIIAVDKYEHRLNLVKQSCERLGVENVEFIPKDALEVDVEPADKVLVDAPCSGLGVIQKKPDIKWQRELSDIRNLAKTQIELLEKASKLVKNGGVIVYSTCTIEPEENIEVVKEFLSRHPEFKIEDARNYLPSDIVNEEGCMETYPHKHDMDGGFAVRLIKVG